MEINGRLVYLIVRPVCAANSDATWDDTGQQRRLELIKRRVRQEIEPLERVELEELQEQFGRYLSHAAPVPMPSRSEYLS